MTRSKPNPSHQGVRPTHEHLACAGIDVERRVDLEPRPGPPLKMHRAKMEVILCGWMYEDRSHEREDLAPCLDLNERGGIPRKFLR